MGRNRGGDGGIPFVRAEDLHIWLISLTLLMVLISSLSFVSQKVVKESPWVDFAILLTWAFAFGSSVLLWSLTLLLNTEKASRVLLLASMCVILIPRSCLPLRAGDSMMQHVCFIGFNFFTARPTWKIYTLCMFGQVVMVISDVVWYAMPPVLLALKTVLALAAIATGHSGYQIVLTFFRQIREAKRLPLPISSCLSAAAECEGKRTDGWPGPPLKEGSHVLSQVLRVQRGRSRDLANLHGPPTICSRFLRRMHRNPVGCKNNVGHRRVTMPHTRVEERRYWTTLENCGPLYYQAVQKRLKLYEDDMLHCATEIEDSGIWCKEHEAQLFIVPNDLYGYVDCKWYLDMNLRRRLRWHCPPPAHGEVGKTAVLTPSKPIVSEGAFSTGNASTPFHTAFPRIDTIEAKEFDLSLFGRSLSAAQCPDPRGGSWEVFGNDPAHAQRAFRDGAQAVGIASNSLEGVSERISGDPPSPGSREAVRREVGVHMMGDTQFGRTQRQSSETTADTRHFCTRRHDGYFHMSSFLEWEAKSCGLGELPRARNGTVNSHGQQDGRRLCSCLADGTEPYSGTGKHEEVLMPKMRLGRFKDSSLERWYILWRADHIVGLYKETASINMLLCALQCLFGMARGLMLEYLSKLMEFFARAPQGSSLTISVTDELGIIVETLASISPGIVLKAFGRHFAQLGILIALILPMKFIDSRGGRNVWKFQLLGLGQAAAHMGFAFFDVLVGCGITSISSVPDSSRTVLTMAKIQIAIGGYLVFPLLMIALNVHLRFIPEAIILIATFGSVVLAMSMHFVFGWDIKSLLLYSMSRLVFASLTIMIARSFENIRRELFSTEVLPFLLYLSTLANSHRVDSIVAMRSKHNKGYHRIDRPMT